MVYAIPSGMQLSKTPFAPFVVELMRFRYDEQLVERWGIFRISEMEKVGEPPHFINFAMRTSFPKTSLKIKEKPLWEDFCTKNLQ